jgi:hypothetical protein
MEDICVGMEMNGLRRLAGERRNDGYILQASAYFIESLISTENAK